MMFEILLQHGNTEQTVTISAVKLKLMSEDNDMGGACLLSECKQLYILVFLPLLCTRLFFSLSIRSVRM